jgi:chromosome segregation ATPase
MTTRPDFLHPNNSPRFVHIDDYEALQRERAAALRRVEVLTEQLTALRASAPSQAQDRATIAQLRGERDALSAEVARLKRQLSEAGAERRLVLPKPSGPALGG